VTALDQGTLHRLRVRLEDERETLRREIQTEGGNPDSGEVGFDLERGFADSAHSTAERARLIAVVEGLRANLQDVEWALSKIDRGMYGICERCGQPIAPERLEALPAARLCITCKQRSS
jgi:DnaK suppressor protein